MSVLQQIRTASNRELARWLAECEAKHPEFINTEATIKDEIRRRDERKRSRTYDQIAPVAGYDI